MFDPQANSMVVGYFQHPITSLSANERTPEKIREIISGAQPHLQALHPDFDMEAIEILARHFEQLFEVRQTYGSSIISQTHQPWLNEQKSEIDFYYWRRFTKYLEHDEKLPPRVIEILDGDTDQILDYCGDPKVTEFQRRGMVVGHVQSGKTASYSSLICKAADAGYKVIILLTGITNSLRRQTQDRINHAFIGRRAELGISISSTPIGAALYSTKEEKKAPVCGTSLERDFSLEAASTISIPIQSLREPIIFTTKKNPSTLSNLLQWLQIYYPNGGIEYPLLLIDDEADNASINTKSKKGEITRINSGIRDILNQFTRASYVAYTATPFANIFISPDSNDEMYNQDLFPKDYIKVLDAPSNYVGPDRVFTEDGDLAEIMVRTPEDYQDILPVKHKNHAKLDHLPASLEEAVLVFLLIRCIRFTLGRENAHCTMMINVSRFNSVQETVSGLVWKFLTSVRDEIRLYGNAPRGLKRSDLLQRMQKLYHEEFLNFLDDVDLPDWKTIQSNLHQASSTITTRVVNMRGGGIEYDQYKKDGLHVIAIGGLALSRGLTLEGLCVSYVLRNPSAYDTLMQMGRWFGYRPGYEKLCRLYLPDFARDYYEHISYATDELRNEIKVMESQGKTPREFGLKVREHPDAIRITAANKMSEATPVFVAISYANKHEEGHAVTVQADTVKKNKETIRQFLKKLPAVFEDKEVNHPEFFWRGVSKTLIRDLLLQFSFPETCISLNSDKRPTSLMVDYLDDRPNELLEWDVCIPESSLGKVHLDLNLHRPIQLRRRDSGELTERGRVLRITKKNRVADRSDASIGLRKEIIDGIDKKADWAFNSRRDHPLLIVHCFSADEIDGLDEKTFVSLSVCLPGTEKLSPNRKYMANQVWKQMNFLDEIGADDADEDLDLYDDI